MKDRTVINIAKRFSRFPSGRALGDGPFPGESFRKDLLVPALEEYQKVVIELDGVRGYNSSFLDEAFGELARQGVLSADDLDSRIEFKSDEFSDVIEEIKQYMTDEDVFDQ